MLARVVRVWAVLPARGTAPGSETGLLTGPCQPHTLGLTWAWSRPVELGALPTVRRGRLSAARGG